MAHATLTRNQEGKQQRRAEKIDLTTQHRIDPTSSSYLGHQKVHRLAHHEVVYLCIVRYDNGIGEE